MKNHPPEILWEKLQLYITNQLSGRERQKIRSLIDSDPHVQELYQHFKKLEQQESPFITLRQQAGNLIKAEPFRKKIQYVVRNYRQLSILYGFENIMPEYGSYIPLNEPSFITKVFLYIKELFTWIGGSAIRKATLGTFLTIALAISGFHLVNNSGKSATTAIFPAEDPMTLFEDYRYIFEGGDSISQLDKEIVQYYVEDKNYPAVITTVQLYIRERAIQGENLKKEDPGYYGGIKFYEAISLIHLDQYTKALDVLTELNEMQSNPETRIGTLDPEIILFYSGLTYLLNGQKDIAVGYLTGLKNCKIPILSNAEYQPLGNIVEQLLDMK